MSGTASLAADRGEVRLDRITISYGKEPVVQAVSLDIAPGEFVCLLGPSGCGKTTTLRSIAGLVGIDDGRILIDGKVANLLPAHRRGIGMVFQDLALFPHMTVHENIAFGLTLRRLDEATIGAKVKDILALLHLAGMEERLPRQLSGGQQQRVALARSLVVNPSVLLLDEPFAALDRKLREEMRREIRALQRQLGITTVFVTHDQEEALTMSDRVVVMNRGRIEQSGTPSEIYERPANRFVLGFVGYANFLRVDRLSESDAETLCEVAGTQLAAPRRVVRGEPGTLVAELAVRPERIRIAESDARAKPVNRLNGTVQDLAFEGALLTYDIVLGDGQRVLVRQPNAGGEDARRQAPGDAVLLEWHADDAVLVRPGAA